MQGHLTSSLVAVMLMLVATPAFSQSASEINDRGNAAYARGAFPDAVAHYGAAITRNPNDASLFHNRGLAELRLAEYPKARADFDKAISLDAGKAAFFNSRGGLFMLTQDYSLAVRDFGEAYRLEPLNAMFLENYRRAEAALSYGKLASVPSTPPALPPVPQDQLIQSQRQHAADCIKYGFDPTIGRAIASNVVGPESQYLFDDPVFGVQNLQSALTRALNPGALGSGGARAMFDLAVSRCR